MPKVWAKDAAGRKVLVPEHWRSDPAITATGIAPVKVTPGEASAIIAAKALAGLGGEASAIIAAKAREGEKEAKNA